MDENFNPEEAYKDYCIKRDFEKSKDWGYVHFALAFAWEWLLRNVFCTVYADYKRMTPELASKVMRTQKIADEHAEKVKISTTLSFAVTLLVPGLALLSSGNLYGSYLIATVGILSVGFAFAINCIFHSYLYWIAHQYYKAAERFTEEIYIPWLKKEHPDYYREMTELINQ